MKSAKEFREVLKGAGYDDDECDAMIKKGIDAGNLFDDLVGVDKGGKNASALLAAFSEAVGPEDALEMVQKAIAKGGVVDDLGLADIVPMSELDAIINKGGEFSADSLFGVDLFDDDGFGEFGEGGGFEPSAFDAFDREIAKSLASIPADVATLARIQKGHGAQIAGVAAQLAAINAQLVEVSKGLAQPLPFATLTGAMPVASPFDAQQGAGGAGQVVAGIQLAADPERDALCGDIEKRIAKGGSVEGAAYGALLAQLAEGAPTGDVRAAFDNLVFDHGQ